MVHHVRGSLTLPLGVKEEKQLVVAFLIYPDALLSPRPERIRPYTWKFCLHFLVLSLLVPSKDYLDKSHIALSKGKKKKKIIRTLTSSHCLLHRFTRFSRIAAGSSRCYVFLQHRVLIKARRVSHPASSYVD